MTTTPLVDVDAPNLDGADRLDVGDRRPQRVSVERIAVQGAGVQYELAAVRPVRRSGDRHLAAELVGARALPFGPRA